MSDNYLLCRKTRKYIWVSPVNTLHEFLQNHMHEDLVYMHDYPQNTDGWEEGYTEVELPKDDV